MIKQSRLVSVYDLSLHSRQNILLTSDPRETLDSQSHTGENTIAHTSCRFSIEGFYISSSPYTNNLEEDSTCFYRVGHCSKSS